MGLLENFSSGLFIIQSIIFIILLLVLRKFAWKPIMDAVNEREETIIDSLNQAKLAKQEVQNLKAENEIIIREAKMERDNILKEAREIKDRIVKHNYKRKVNVSICGKSKTFRGYIDTGNELTDPITGKPVMVVNIDCIKEILGDELCNKIMEFYGDINVRC